MNYDDNHETILRLRAQVAALTARAEAAEAARWSPEEAAPAFGLDSTGALHFADPAPAVTREEVVEALRMSYELFVAIYGHSRRGGERTVWLTTIEHHASAGAQDARALLAHIDAEGGGS